MKFIDLFAGIGGFRFGMESAGHECVAFCEIDKFARASYKAIHNTEGEIELHDITTVTDDEIRNIGHVDAICGGFPCQAFSIAGHLRGQRGRKVFPIGGKDEKSSAERLGINILGNTKNPNGTAQGTRDIVHDPEGIVGTLTAPDYKGPKQVAIPNEIRKYGVLQPNFNQSGVVYETDGISPTIRTMQGGGLEPKIRVREATKQGYAEASVGDSVNLSHPNSKTRRGRVGEGIANTLVTGDSQGVVMPNFRIRKLTPRECWRLQGFPDWAFDKAQEVNSNSQLYKQAGNSVTVNVIKKIARYL